MITITRKVVAVVALFGITSGVVLAAGAHPAGRVAAGRHTEKRSVSPVDTVVTQSRFAQVERVTASGGTGGGDYLGELGGVTRWQQGKNIRVYVAPGRASFKSIVASAMNTWSRASGGRFTWTLVGDPRAADYTISWSGQQREVSTGTEAGLTTTDTMQNRDGTETIERAHTRILTRLDGSPLPDAEIAETVLHEIGHGLGLDGHSSSPKDIMYYAAAQGQGGLTARDMNTMQKLYAE